MEDQLIHSFLVDKDASYCGFPFFAPGKQPKVSVPPFFPDNVKPYITETEAKALFERFDRISHKTGAPFFPMIGIPFFMMILVGIINFSLFPSLPGGVVVLGIGMVPISFFIILGVILFLASKRKTDMKNLLEEWNIGRKPRGIYFAFGTEDGISPDDFFNTRRTSERSFRDRRNFTVKTNSMIHLYMNPTARQEWEQHHHQQQQQHNHPQQQQSGSTATQPPNYGGGGGYVDLPPSYNDAVTKS